MGLLDFFLELSRLLEGNYEVVLLELFEVEFVFLRVYFLIQPQVGSFGSVFE